MPTEQLRWRRFHPVVAVLLLADLSGSALAQSRTGWSLEPRVTVTETITNNVVTDSTTPQADSITQLSPGFRLVGRGARVDVSVDYSLNELIYARDSSRNQRQNSLNALGTIEAIDNWFFIDLSWLIAQQTISAFGAQSTSNVNVDGNRTETSSANVSPYIRGHIGTYATYDLRYALTTTRSKSALATDSETEQWSARLSGATAFSSLGWALSFSANTNRVSLGRDTEDSRSIVELNYRLNPEWRFAVTAGRESQDIDSPTKTGGGTGGVTVGWTPSSRTSLLASAEKRGFGNTHQISFDHRTPLSVWRFSDTREAALLPAQLTSIGQGSIYDLMYAQLESSFPDPAARAQQVTDILRQTGIQPNVNVTSGFLTSRTSMQRRQELSLVLIGKRNTVTYTLTRSEQDALGVATGAVDDFATNSKIQQRGFSSNWAYRLTEFTSLGILNSRQTSTGNGAGTQQSKQNLLTLNVTTKFGAKTSGSLAATRSTATGQVGQAQRDENTMVGTLSMQF